MLEHLDIKNFALIENLSIDFSDGFNVITGETGSGKSIILGALGLLMGEKADSSSIRTGCDEMTVNAVLSVPEKHEIRSYLEEHDITLEDDALIIRRVVKSNGRSSISIQGQIVTRQELAYVADSLIDMHGQSEHQSLLLPDKQRKIVDSYAQNEELLSSCSKLCHQISELNKKKEELLAQIEEGKKNRDYLEFAFDEIDSAKIEENEDEILKDKVKVISQYETIFESLNIASEQFKQMRTLLYDASANCHKAAKCDPDLESYQQRLDSLRLEAEDIDLGLKEYLSNVSYSEDKVNQMQERLALLQKLKRKYGPTLNDVISFKEDAKHKLDISDNCQEYLKKCSDELDSLFASYQEVAKKLSFNRSTSSENLEKKIEKTLRTLGMPNANFKIEISTDLSKLSVNGIDSISFMISANPGEPLKQMKDIASGGELSRVMLALKTVLAKNDEIQTQVFDEVDSGIGGSVALSLASCIKDLSSQKQVIAITHLASIASKADSQFVVSKTVENGRTYTHLRLSEGSDRIHEIARMLSGDESEVSLEHAKNLLEL